MPWPALFTRKVNDAPGGTDYAARIARARCNAVVTHCAIAAGTDESRNGIMSLAAQMR